MCVLLGLSANIAADIRFSFSGLKQRGGNTGEHSDGWDMSLYEGCGSRSFHDPKPGYSSEVTHFFTPPQSKAR